MIIREIHKSVKISDSDKKGHGGKVEVTSKVGEGIEFIIELPITG